MSDAEMISLLRGSYDSCGNEESENRKRLSTGVIYKKEVEYILKSSAPLAITFFLQYLLPVTCIYFASRLGESELAAVTLATSSFTISGLAIYQGLSTCLDSLCSQAYGAGHHDLVGLYFQRCVTIGIVITLFPLSFLWWNSGKIFKYFVKDTHVIELTQLYLRINIIGAPALLFFETGKRFLQAQHIFKPGSYIMIFVSLANIVLNWLLVLNEGTSLGYIGAPIAVVCSYWLMPACILIYVKVFDGKRCWNGFHIEKCFLNWGPLLSLAIPGIIMTEAEYIACQTINLLAATIGTAELAAQSITSNVGFLSFQLSFSLSVAIGTRLGYYVGNKDILLCRVLIKIAVIMGSFLSLSNFCIIYFNRERFGRLFTNSKEVLEISNITLTLSAINQLSDVMNVISVGVLRGQGRQKLGSVLTILAYYTISFPVGYYFGVVKSLNLVGFWYGYITGVIFLAVFEMAFIFSSDWVSIFRNSSNLRNEA